MTRPRVLALLAIALALAAWSLVPTLLAVNSHDGVYLGADGPFAGDQLQYLSWVRESGEHIVVRNLYDGQEESAHFVHPMFLVSGGLWRVGLGLAPSLLIWKPVAIAALVVAFAAFARRSLDGAQEGSATLLAVFATSPLLAVSSWLGPAGLDPELPAATLTSPAAHVTWGYLPTALALALLVVFLLALARLVDHAHRASARAIAATSAVGAVMGWLHPWQGVIGLLVVGVALGWGALRGEGLRRWWPAALPTVAATAPIAYYLVLGRASSAWEVSQTHLAQEAPDLLKVVLGLAPLLALAPFARVSGAVVYDRFLIAWPVAAIAASLSLGTIDPTHFLAGVTLPLSVLAVRGWCAIAPRGKTGAIAAFVVVVALTLPGLAAAGRWAGEAVRPVGQPHVVRGGEAAALSWLEDAPRGVVLTRLYLGQAVPALSGQPVWVGHPTWTHDFSERVRWAEALFAGDLDRDDAAGVVRRSNARYVLVDCASTLPSGAIERPVAEHRFGCARIVEVAL